MCRGKAGGSMFTINANAATIRLQSEDSGIMLILRESKEDNDVARTKCLITNNKGKSPLPTYFFLWPVQRKWKEQAVHMNECVGGSQGGCVGAYKIMHV